MPSVIDLFYSYEPHARASLDPELLLISASEWKELRRRFSAADLLSQMGADPERFSFILPAHRVLMTDSTIKVEDDPSPPAAEATVLSIHRDIHAGLAQRGNADYTPDEVEVIAETYAAAGQTAEETKAAISSGGPPTVLMQLRRRLDHLIDIRWGIAALLAPFTDRHQHTIAARGVDPEEVKDRALAQDVGAPAFRQARLEAAILGAGGWPSDLTLQGSPCATPRDLMQVLARRPAPDLMVLVDVVQEYADLLICCDRLEQAIAPVLTSMEGWVAGSIANPHAPGARAHRLRPHLLEAVQRRTDLVRFLQRRPSEVAALAPPCAERLAADAERLAPVASMAVPNAGAPPAPADAPGPEPEAPGRQPVGQPPASGAQREPPAAPARCEPPAAPAPAPAPPATPAPKPSGPAPAPRRYRPSRIYLPVPTGRVEEMVRRGAERHGTAAVVRSESADAFDDVLPFAWRSQAPLIRVERAPRSAGRLADPKELFHADYWRHLCDATLTRAGHRCELCGEAGATYALPAGLADPVLVIPVWSYHETDDPGTPGVMQLVRFSSVCQDCWLCFQPEEVASYGLQADARRHLARLNGHDAEAADHMELVRDRVYAHRSQRPWTLDLGLLGRAAVGVVLAASEAVKQAIVYGASYQHGPKGEARPQRPYPVWYQPSARPDLAALELRLGLDPAKPVVPLAEPARVSAGPQAGARSGAAPSAPPIATPPPLEARPPEARLPARTPVATTTTIAVPLPAPPAAPLRRKAPKGMHRNTGGAPLRRLLVLAAASCGLILAFGVGILSFAGRGPAGSPGGGTSFARVSGYDLVPLASELPKAGQAAPPLTGPDGRPVSIAPGGRYHVGRTVAGWVEVAFEFDGQKRVGWVPESRVTLVPP